MRILIVIFLLNIPVILSGQGNQLRSFQEQYVNANGQSEKSNAAKLLATLYQGKNLDSALYYSLQYFKLSDEDLKTTARGGLALNLADLYIKKNELDSAKKYYIISRENLTETDSIYNYVKSSMRLGNIYLAQNDYINSLQLYQECLVLTEKNNYVDLTPHLYNNLGLLYKELEDYEDATANFETAYEMFLQNGDEANSVYPSYNIALIQSNTGRNQEAIDGYLTLANYHVKTENWLSLAYIYNSISEIYYWNKDYELARNYVQMALTALEEKTDSFNSGPSSLYQSAIYSNAAEVYYAIGSLPIAKKYARTGYQISKENSYILNLLKSIKVIADVYEKEGKLDSSAVYLNKYIASSEVYKNENDVKQLTKLKMQSEFDKILREREIERIYKEAQYKNRELSFMALIGLASLLVIIMILLYKNQKNKNAKLSLIEENLQLEKRKLNQDLDHKKKELVSKLLYLLEKNEFITSISKKLIELRPDAKKDNRDTLQKIINEIRLNSSNQIWDEFELRFTEVHSEFYKKLHEMHPDLTPNEVKLCAFLRLNMSTKEISAITHQSVKSINMARFRLRKKLDMNRDENLISHLNSIL